MVTESGITVSGNTLLELMKHIGNDRHLTMKQPMETVLTRSEWKLRWEASARGAKVERKSWGLGPEGMGKIRGICRQHMPACTV